MLRRTSFAIVAIIALASLGPSPVVSGGSIPQGTQSNQKYASSGSGVTTVSATTQKLSCYTPLVPFATSDGPNDGYTGESVCPGANTGEDLGPYPTQAGANPGYPAATPMLVKDHSESDIRVDPLDPSHLIGTSKWFVSAEGYNHLLGFYESFDGGASWPVQGHIPGYEGWTDNTDPVGAFDTYGNFYSLNLGYQFFYNADGSHNFAINQNKEPNPAEPAEMISVSVRPHGATAATDWLVTNSAGQPDIVAAYPNKGNEPDKQWIAIDRNPKSPFVDRIYAMWVDFTGCCTPHAVVSWATANADGTHSDWSVPVPIPNGPNMPQGATYLLPHVARDGSLWTTLTNGGPAHQYASDKIVIARSNDGGITWTFVGTVVDNIVAPPFVYANTTFRDGILNSFAVGPKLVRGHYPLYVAYEDAGEGVTSILLTASYDDGFTWSSPFRVNDNPAPADAFQPTVTTAASGTVGVAFYDRRLACPTAGTEATAAGIGLDQTNPNYAGTPPYGAANYCVNASAQFYAADLTPKGHNIRLSAHTFDPQLNAPHTGCPTCRTTFLGDYFGFDTGGTKAFFTFVSTYNGGANPQHYQQQIVASVAIP